MHQTLAPILAPSKKCETKFDMTEFKTGLALIQFGGKGVIKMIDLAVPKSAESTLKRVHFCVFCCYQIWQYCVTKFASSTFQFAKNWCSKFNFVQFLFVGARMGATV